MSNILDDYLVDRKEDEEIDETKYIKPSIEMKLSPEKRMECRQIVQSINEFGISQRQLVYLIQLLSLQVENNDLMRKLVACIKEERENVALTLQDEATSSKIIID